MLIPLILAASAAALAGTLYYLLWGFRKKPPKKQPAGEASQPHLAGKPEDGSAAGSGSGSKPSSPERPRWRDRTAAAIDEIVARIRFAEGTAVTKRVKVGERLQPSPIPTDEIEVRTIHDADEIPNVMTDALAQDDDPFYGAFAAGTLPVLECQERVDVIEDVAGVPRNILVLIVDVSGSMDENGRINWTWALCRAAIARAIRENAEVALLPFTEEPRDWHVAKNKDECEALSQALQNILIPNGGTNIWNALREGLRFLADESFTDRKILLVTDGRDESINVSAARANLAKLHTELNTVCLGSENLSLSAVSANYDLFKDR